MSQYHNTTIEVNLTMMIINNIFINISEMCHLDDDVHNEYHKDDLQ